MVIIDLNPATDEYRFMQSIVGDVFHPKVSVDMLGPNYAAQQFFMAVQNAYSSNYHKCPGSHTRIPTELVSYLAACAWVSLGYDRKHSIPWTSGKHDHVFTRAVRAFMVAMREALQEGHVIYEKEAAYFGRFRIPQWLVEKHAPKQRTA